MHSGGNRRHKSTQSGHLDVSMSQPSPTETEEESAISTIHVRYCSPHFTKAAKAWLAIPPDLPNQGVEIVHIAPQPLLEYRSGPNTIAYFELNDGGYIELSMKIHRCETKGPQPGSVSEGDLLDEPFITVTHEVRMKALEIVASVYDKKDQAKLLFNWVRDNIAYRHPPAVWGNLAALNSRTGDCGSSSFLFVSFCRALGIPARVVFGRIVNDEGKSTPHAWAECYVDGWLPVDCSMARDARRALFSPCDYFGTYSNPDTYFGNLDNKRLVYSIGVGIVPQPTYPRIIGEGKRRVQTHDAVFSWGKNLYQDRIPFLQPIYYACEEDLASQGKLHVDVNRAHMIVDPIMAKLFALLIPLFLFMSSLSPFFRDLLLGSILVMLLGNTITWKGKTRAFWASVLAIAIVIVVMNRLIFI